MKHSQTLWMISEKEVTNLILQHKQCAFIARDLDIRLDPEDFTVDEVYRIEGDSTPDYNVVLYAISSSTGVKGTLIDGYEVYSGQLSFEMTKKLQNSPGTIY